MNVLYIGSISGSILASFPASMTKSLLDAWSISGEQGEGGERAGPLSLSSLQVGGKNRRGIMLTQVT